MRKREESVLSSVLSSGAIGAVGSMVTAIILTAVAANLVKMETVTEGAIDGLTAGVLLVSSVGGSLFAARLCGHHRLQTCLVAGGIYFLLLLACTAMLFDGVYRGVGVTALLILGGSGGAVLLGLKEGKKRKRFSGANKRYRKVVQN